MTKITIPESVKVIESGSFENCSSLESINIPKHVTRIGERAFRECSNLSSIDLPDSLTYISDQSFQNCSKLYSITIPRKVISLGGNAFYGCDRLTLVASLNETPPTLNFWNPFSRIPILLVPHSSKETYSSTGWNTYIFNGTTVMEFDFSEGEFLVLRSSEGGKIIYDGQETTGDTKVFAVKKGHDILLKTELDANYEFASCVIDGDSIKELARESDNVFSCTLKAEKGHIVDATFAKLFVEDSIIARDNMYYKVLQSNEVELFPRISYFRSPDGSRTTLYSGYIGNVIIPDSIVIPASLSHPKREYKVTGINNSAFQNGYYSSSSTELTSVVIGNNVTSIPDRTFSDCKNLTSIVISKKVTNIGAYAFSGCSNLSTINIPDKVSNIGAGAFASCRSLINVNLPKGITIIGDETFLNCASLTDIILPDEITQIGACAFYGCSGLSSIVIPNTVIRIDKSTFALSGLVSLNIPGSVTSIGDYAFYNCSGLNSVTIPNSVTSIGDNAFAYCDKLTDINIPNSVTIIGKETFYNTGWYNNQPDGLVYAGKVAYKYKGEMSENTNIELIDGTLGIAAEAFRNNPGLSSIYIPSSVNNIGDFAFYRCSGLESVVLLNQTPPSIGKKTFSSYNATLYVPNGSKEAYKNTEYWKNFTIIIEGDPYSEDTKETELTNGDFEIWTDGMPTGWKSDSSASTATLSQSTNAHGGSYSVIINGDEKGNKRLASKEMTLPAGTYVFSFYAKATTDDPAQIRAGYVPIIDGVPSSYHYGEYANLNNTDWTQVRFEFDLIEETTICLVIMNPMKSNYSSGKDVLVDDATLSSGGSSTINSVLTGNNSITDVYTIDGKRTDILHKGLNIVHYKDGTMKKIIIK